MRTVVRNYIWASLELKYPISDWTHQNPQVLINQHGRKIQLNIQKLISDINNNGLKIQTQMSRSPYGPATVYMHFLDIHMIFIIA